MLVTVDSRLGGPTDSSSNPSGVCVVGMNPKEALPPSGHPGCSNYQKSELNIAMMAISR